MTDWSGTVSILLGGSAWIIPNLYFIHKMFKPQTKRDAKDLLKDFLVGEGLKLLISIGLIVTIMRFFSVKPVELVSGYIATVIASFFTPLLCYPAKKQES